MMSYPDHQPPPPYSENPSSDEPNASKKLLEEQPGPKGYGATSLMPSQYQPYGAGYGQGPIITQPTPAVVFIQPLNEPEHLAFSIFTMLCCCLPLGIAALVYSIRTREANCSGNLASAQHNSQRAHILNLLGLGFGIVFLILYIILIVTFYDKLSHTHP